MSAYFSDKELSDLLSYTDTETGERRSENRINPEMHERIVADFIDKTVRARCEELEKVLGFYADAENWSKRVPVMIQGQPMEATVIGEDHGRKARGALNPKGDAPS